MTIKGRKYNWNIEELNIEKSRKEYKEEIERQMRSEISDEDSIETRWNTIKKFINSAAEKCIGRKGKKKTQRMV